MEHPDQKRLTRGANGKADDQGIKKAFLFWHFNLVFIYIKSYCLAVCFFFFYSRKLCLYLLDR